MSSSQDLEPEAESLLKAGTKICDSMSDIPALYSIAISLKRIADALQKPEVQVTEYIKPEIFFNKS